MNQETFKHTVFIHKDKMYRFATRFFAYQEDAFDVVQEVMLKLWEIRHQLENIKSIEGYAMNMVRNLAFNKIDKAKRQATYLEQLPNDSQSEKYPELTRELILKLIDSLPEKQRTVMYLRDIEEYEIENIAELTKMEENAVRVNLSRARNTIKIQLNKIFEYEKRRIG
ncbi:RNA polymerase sigma factor [Sphingobacterium sp. HJSM2_6]|uniref:RNA polymerase sigma factor n=1 Tax=Sphingobacterium sp. HJSM2_6 TaxID=3366264 RepID=UPI003BCB492F